MLSAINPSAGTQSIQSSAMQMRTSVGGSGPTAPATTPRSRAQTNVSELFQITAALNQQLNSRMDGAEANRIQGGEGLDATGVTKSLTEIKEKLDAMRARAPMLTRFTDKLTAELSEAVKTGRGSNARIEETVRETQQAMASKYGYVGNIINKAA